MPCPPLPLHSPARSSVFAIGPEQSATSKFVPILEMVVRVLHFVRSAGRGRSPHLRHSLQEEPRYHAFEESVPLLLIGGGCRARGSNASGSSNAGVKWQNNLANVCAANGDDSGREREREEVIYNKRSSRTRRRMAGRREKEGGEGRSSLNSRLWAAPLSSQSGGYPSRAEQRRGEERRSGQRRTRLRRRRRRGCFEICPSRDRRSFNLDKHHFRGRNTRRADGEGGRATRSE